MITYHAEIEQIHEDGAMVTATSHVGRCPAGGSGDILCPCRRARRRAGSCSIELDFLVWLNLRLFEVGRKRTVELEVPPKLAAAAATLADGSAAVTDQPLEGSGQP